MVDTPGAPGTASAKTDSTPAAPPNVLFVMVDDLRPELGCYGVDVISSPNLDRFARSGVQFNQAYCNFPVCGASRASLLTGLRPARGRFTKFDTYAHEDAPGAVTLPERFRAAGYTTIANGKIFHHPDDSPEAWDEVWRPEEPGGWLKYQTAENLAFVARGERGRPYERAAVHDTAYFDGRLANKAIRDLRRLQAAGQPFFLAVGFIKPHLPFNAPEEYWARYDGRVRLPDNDYVPHGAPPESIHNSGELRNYQGMQSLPLDDATALKLKQGYYAAVSYMDAQVGRLLDALNELGLADNTIVIVLGDHGYNLREHTMWCKHANYRTSLRTALLMRDPRSAARGQVNGLVEFVDIYPTLLEAAGLPAAPGLEGRSFMPLVRDPQGPGRDFVISKHNMGLTITTPTAAYTEYLGADLRPQARMLYDHVRDPHENRNVVDSAALAPEVARLSAQLRAHWGKDF